MNKGGLSFGEIEATVLDAERLANELDALGPDGGAESMLFARALRTMARNLRFALVSPPDEIMLMKMVLSLETTIRRVSARAIDAGGPPASQRPTLPPPAGLTPREVWDSLPPSKPRGPETVRCPVPKDSEIRAKVEPPDGEVVPPSRRKTS
jgi:hypothetical protein